ncbi:hypothetical protein ACYSUW_14570 [Pseudomonas frederiksbergensis]
MAFNFHCDADLSALNVRKFLNDRDQITYTSPVPGADDPDLLLVPGPDAQKPLGSFVDAAGNPLTQLAGEVACRYDLFEKQSLISSSIKAVPVTYTVDVQLHAQLLVRHGAEANIGDLQVALAAFDPQTQSAEDIADQLATRAVNPIKRDQYLVSVFYVITKMDRGELHDELPRDWETSLNKQCATSDNKTRSTINGAEMCATLQDGGYRTVITELGPDVTPPAKTKDPVHEVEASDPNDPAVVKKAYDGVVALNSPADCPMLTREDPIRVAEIFSYPQVKIEWMTATFKIGCVHVSVTYPVLRWRLATIVLYALLAHAPMNFDDWTKKQVVEVIIVSALLAAIVFYATENFAVAYETFKGGMTTGLKRVFGDMIKCLLPEIIVITETGNWT